MSSIFHYLDTFFHNLLGTPNTPPPPSYTIPPEPPKPITDLPVFRYRLVDRIKEKQCPICLVDFVIGDFIPYLSCEHYFHYSCFRQWLEHKPECCVCRQNPLTQESVEEAKRQRRHFLKRVFCTKE